VRVLAEEIGAALGTCAHLAALRRTGTGGFRIDDAITLEALQDLDPAARGHRLMPVDALVDALPRLDLSDEQAVAVRHGRPIPHEGPACVRAYDPAGRLVGVLERDGGWLKARRLLRTDG
jgi:tRNA pseudouridine55 synthase